MKWVYSFSVWPDETNPKWNRAMFDLFRMLTTRVELDMTEDDFDVFRADLSRVGITLREISRVPYVATEPVF